MSHRNFEIMSGRLATGAHHQSSATRDAIIPRDLYLPSGSILSPADLPLPRSKLAQTMLDIFALAFGAFFLCATAASLPVAIFLLFFCSF